MYLLFDIGGTHTRLALSENGDAYSDVVEYPTPQKYTEGISLLVSHAQELAQGKTLKYGVGGVAASFDRKGEILTGGGPQISDWLLKPIKKGLEEALGCSVHIKNDAMMGALAQSHYGAAQDKKISAYVTVSTGLGGARIVNGKIDANTFGFEPGWQIIDAGNALCNSWSEKGYLIDYTSGLGISRNKNVSPEDIQDDAFWESRAELLAYGLHNIALMWSPEVISIGGAIGERIPLETVNHYYTQTISRVYPHEYPALVRADFGDEMGLWGALGYIKMYIHTS